MFTISDGIKHVTQANAAGPSFHGQAKEYWRLPLLGKEKFCTTVGPVSMLA